MGRTKLFTILTVCTGNICRSPAAEILLSRALDHSVTVTSAGTYGMPSWPVSPPMARLLATGESDSDVAAFRSTTLTAQRIQDADLILALAGEHKRAILELVPSALRRTFTLGEFARLAASVPYENVAADRTDQVDGVIDRVGDGPNLTDAGRFSELVKAANRQRSQIPHRKPGDDVIDPYGLGDQVYAQSYAQIQADIAQILAALSREGTAR